MNIIQEQRKSPFPILFDISLRFNIAKKMITQQRKKDSEIGRFLDVLTFSDFMFLQIDFVSFYYTLTGQIKFEKILQEIITNAKALIGLDLNDVEAFDIFNFGLRHAQEGNYTKAIKCLQEAIELARDNPIYQMELSRIYFNIGKIKKGNDLRNKAEKIIKQQNDPKFLKQKYSELINSFNSKKEKMKGITHRRKEYQNILKDEDGLTSHLNILTKELAKYFKGEKTFPEKILPSIIDDCLECLEWLSILGSLIFFQLEQKLGDNRLNDDLKEAIIHSLGWIPEDIPSDETPNFLSPKIRKKAWGAQLGMDIMTGAFMDSMKVAEFYRIDRNVKNDDPQNFTWILKKSKDKVDLDINISEVHADHRDVEREKIAEHIERHFGEPLMIIHDKKSGLVHIDIYVIPPSEERNFAMLITSGMSEKPMEAPPDAWRCWPIDITKVPEEMREIFNCRYAELVLKLPPDWHLPQLDGELKKDEYVWPTLELHHLINYVHKNSQWFWHGHTMRSRSDDSLPFSPETKLSGWVFVHPPNLPPSFGILKISDSKAICFLQIVPAYIEEIMYAMKHSTEALIDKFTQYGIPDYIDIKRKNICL